MKKIMVAAFLVIVLSFSLVVPVFAADPVRIIGSYYYNPFDSWNGSGFGGGTHTTTPATWTLSEEDFLSLYYGAVESNSNGYSFSLRRNGSYTFIYVLSPSTTKALGLLCNQKGTVYRCSSIVHSELYLISSIIDYIDQIEGRLARTVGDTVYTVADSTYNTWQTLKDMSGTVDKIAGRLLNYTDDGVGHTVAESAYWGYQKTIDIYNRLGNISGYVDQIEDRLLVYSSDGVGHTVAESAYWDYQKTIDIYSRLGSTNSKLDSIFSVVDMNSNYGSRIVTRLNNVISRLDTIIENQQISSGLSTCDHQYVSEVSQEPDCTLPGLMVHTCELCEASYSEIMDPLGHDWLCTDHVEAVTDESGEVLESGYDIYTCQRCDQIYYDYDGTGAPDPGHGSTVTDLITAVFTKLGNFVGGLVSAVINLLDKLLTGFDSIVSDFNDRTNQIVNFGGAYPAWLGGIWEIIPADLQLALGFCVVCLALGIIGKKVVFS